MKSFCFGIAALVVLLASSSVEAGLFRNRCHQKTTCAAPCVAAPAACCNQPVQPVVAPVATPACCSQPVQPVAQHHPVAHAVHDVAHAVAQVPHAVVQKVCNGRTCVNQTVYISN